MTVADTAISSRRTARRPRVFYLDLIRALAAVLIVLTPLNYHLREHGGGYVLTFQPLRCLCGAALGVSPVPHHLWCRPDPDLPAAHQPQTLLLEAVRQHLPDVLDRLGAGDSLLLPHLQRAASQRRSGEVLHLHASGSRRPRRSLRLAHDVSAGDRCAVDLPAGVEQAVLDASSMLRGKTTPEAYIQIWLKICHR